MAEFLSVDVFRWVEVAVAVAATFLIAYIASWVLTRVLEKTPFPAEPGRRIVRIVRYFIYALGAALIIAYLAFDIIGAFVGLGIFGLALGFGLGGVFSSWVAGLTVIIGKSFAVGDEISVGVFEGKVVKISLSK